MSAFNPRNCKPFPKKGDPKRQLPGFETKQEVAERQAKLICTLEKGNQDAVEAAQKIRECGQGQDCLTPICPKCLRMFRRWYVSQLERLTRPHELWAITVVPPRVRFAPGELHNLDLCQFKETFSKQVSRAGFHNLVMFGGVDIDFCVHSDNDFYPHWAPHLHCLFIGENGQEVKAALGRFYPPDHIAPRPIRAEKVKDPMEAISYPMKPFFGRRVSYIGGNGRRQSRDLRLQADELQEIGAYMGQHKHTDLLFLKNVRRRGCNLALNGCR